MDAEETEGAKEAEDAENTKGGAKDSKETEDTKEAEDSKEAEEREFRGTGRECALGIPTLLLFTFHLSHPDGHPVPPRFRASEIPCLPAPVPP